MATEIHGYIKTFLILAAVVFAGGGYVMKQGDNTGRIVKVEEVNHSQSEQIHSLELADKDILNIAEKSLETMGHINHKLELIQSTQTTQSILLDRNTIKLETLRKD